MRALLHYGRNYRGELVILASTGIGARWNNRTVLAQLHACDVERERESENSPVTFFSRLSWAVFSSKKTPPQTPNFPSHLHHIKTLNIANDSWSTKCS